MQNKPELVHRLLTNPTYAVGLLRKSLNGQVLTGAALLVLSLHAVWTELRPDGRTYFASDGIVDPVPMKPLNEPLVSEPMLLDWTASAVLRAYSINFVTYRETSQIARRAFTDDAWNSWAGSFISTGNLKKITEARLTTRAVPVQTPTIREQDVVNGRQAWVIEFPMLLSYENVNEISKETVLIQATVMRTDDPKFPRGIAIVQLIAGPYMGR